MDMFSTTPQIKIILIITGLFLVLQYTYQFLIGLIRQLQRFIPSNLLKKYGEGSWALVTGATDGIGRSFADQLAKRGFNLILLSRNKSKLEKTREEIHAITNKIQIKIVLADLANSHQPRFFDDLYQQVKDLDISLLINNAGLFYMDSFHIGNENGFMDLITVNIFPYVLLTRKLIGQMRTRSNRAGIINVSSLACLSPMPYMGLYAATKAFEDHFTRSLDTEYPEIDFLSVRPHFVSTKLTLHKKISLDTISAEDCAEGSLRDLGRYSTTSAYITHDLAAWLLPRVPSFIINFVSKNIFIPLEWRRKRLAQEKLDQKNK